MATLADLLMYRGKNGADYVGVNGLPENSPVRGLAEGSPGTHFVNHNLYSVAPETLYNLDPTFGINTIYQQFLGRAPDAEGLKYWQDQQKGGASYQDFMQGIKGSQEFTRVTPDQRAYVQAQADAGFPTMVNMGARNGAPSYGSKDGAVRRTYAEMLGRLPSQAELAYYEPLWEQNGMDANWLRRTVMQSPEYQQYQATGIAAQTDTTNPLDRLINNKNVINGYAGMGGQVVRPKAINYELDGAQRNWDAMKGRYGDTSSQAWQASQDYWNARGNALNGGAPRQQQRGGMGGGVAPDWLRGNEVDQWQNNFGEPGYRLTPQGGNSGGSWGGRNQMNAPMTLGRLTGRR